jgi:1-acyl-sn-glycerol-3-phosphate acyltransferase
MFKLFARFLLKLHGWKVNKVVPKEAQKCVMIAAPHTTNWDFYYMRIAFAILDIPMKATIKDFWTQFPFGLIILPLGGLGINRKPKKPNEPRKSYVEQMAAFFNDYDRIAMVVAAEGTRSLVTEWKLGFYHTAKMANVPITFGYLDYEKKEAGVGGAIHLTDNMEADLKNIMDFYKNIAPKYPEKYSVDVRFAK